MGVGDQRHAPAAYLRERTGTHCEGGYVGSRPRSRHVQKNSPPPGFDPRAGSGWL